MNRIMKFFCENTEFLVLGILFGLVGTFAGSLAVLHPRVGFPKLFGPCFLATGIVSLFFSLAMVWPMNRFRVVRRDYPKTFGLSFPLNRIEQLIQQPGVNMKLKEFASILNDAYRRKTNLLGTLPLRNSTQTISSVKKTLSDLDEIEASISDRKKVFWKAHALARKAGFWTLKYSGDYLVLKEHKEQTY